MLNDIQYLKSRNEPWIDKTSAQHLHEHIESRIEKECGNLGNIIKNKNRKGPNFFPLMDNIVNRDLSSYSPYNM